MVLFRRRQQHLANLPPSCPPLPHGAFPPQPPSLGHTLQGAGLGLALASPAHHPALGRSDPAQQNQLGQRYLLYFFLRLRSTPQASDLGGL